MKFLNQLWSSYKRCYVAKNFKKIIPTYTTQPSHLNMKKNQVQKGKHIILSIISFLAMAVIVYYLIQLSSIVLSSVLLLFI